MAWWIVTSISIAKQSEADPNLGGMVWEALIYDLNFRMIHEMLLIGEKVSWRSKYVYGLVSTSLWWAMDGILKV